MVRRETKMLQIEYGVVGGNPFGLIKAPAPMAVVMTGLEKPGAPSFCGDTFSEGRNFRAQQVSMDYILDGHIPLEKPMNDLIVDHRSSKPLKYKRVKSGSLALLPAPSLLI